MIKVLKVSYTTRVLYCNVCKKPLCDKTPFVSINHDFYSFTRVHKSCLQKFLDKPHKTYRQYLYAMQKRKKQEVFRAL